MIAFHTKNSTYEIAEKNGLFQITKIAVHHPSEYLSVGDTRLSDRMYVQVGDRARFAGWSTSRVIGIGAVRPEEDACPTS